MATWEMQLLSRVIRTGDLSSVVSWGVTGDDFLSSEGKQMYEFIQAYSMQAATAGSVVGTSAMTHFFPNFILCDDPGMTTQALCRQVRFDRLSMQYRHDSARGLEICQSNPLEAAQYSQRSSLDLVNLGFGRTTDIHASVGAEKVQNRYMLREQGVDMSCGRWPWQIIDDEMGGFTNDDYVVFFGRPKSFKSWILVYLICSLMTQGKRILVYTKEMTWEQMYERIICCVAGIRHWNLRKGLLSPEERVVFYETSLMFRMPDVSSQLTILSGLDADGNDTPSWIRSKIENYKPDFVCIDGLHLMADSKKARKREERITNISRDTRAMVLQTGVPVIVTVQANRAAATNSDANLEEIAYSDALAQDATAVIRTIKDKSCDEQPESTVSLVVGALRNGVMDGFRIHADPATNFEYHSVLSAYDAAKLKGQEGQGNGGFKKPTEGTAADLGKRRSDRAVHGRA